MLFLQLTWYKVSSATRLEKKVEPPPVDWSFTPPPGWWSHCRAAILCFLMELGSQFLYTNTSSCLTVNKTSCWCICCASRTCVFNLRGLKSQLVFCFSPADLVHFNEPFWICCDSSTLVTVIIIVVLSYLGQDVISLLLNCIIFADKPCRPS